MRIDDPRRLFLGALGTLWIERALPAQAIDDVDSWGRFEVVPGRPGIVVGIPHATADTGTAEVGRALCRRTGASGIFATGFWFAKTRQRINVNRPTEQIIGADSEVLQQWQSERARAANARYVALVKDAAQGPLRAFYEIHSNHRPPLAGSIEVSTIGVPYRSARRFKDAFHASRDRLAGDAPRLDLHISPVDKVTYPIYGNASSIATLSRRGCAIEHPAAALTQRAWRLAYAECLADAIEAAPWDRA